MGHRRSTLLGLVIVGVATALAADFAPGQTTSVTDGKKDSRRPFARPGTPRRAERLRTFDVEHINAELTIVPDEGRVEGTVTHTIRPLHPHLTRLDLDCESNLEVKAVVAGRAREACGFSRDGDGLRIDLDRPYGPDEVLNLTVAYRGWPTRGLYFIPSDPAYPDRPAAVWSAGWAEENHYWLPCYDYPNDRATSEMVVTVPKPFTALSNGALLGVVEHRDGTRTFHWKMEVPHPSYLISLAVEDFAVYRDRAGDVPVEYYVARSVDEATARRALGETPRMIAFFNDRIGTPYPYAKYAQAVVPDFPGGLENISATTLTENALRDPIAAREEDSEFLVSHELAHQWFGDLLSPRDWSQVWLSEGFATYFADLWAEHAHGDDALRLEMAREFQAYLANDRIYRRPIVESRYEDPYNLLDAVSYPKAACVLHALRGLIGDEAWWGGIRRYVREHKAEDVVTDDFRKAMEAASGRDLAWFFDQWVFKAGHPELKARWRYEPEDRTARVVVEQVQAVDDATPLFRLPTTLELSDHAGSRSVAIVIDGPRQEFIIPSPTEPMMVRIDPKGWIPKTLGFDKPPAQWIYQLAHAPDALGRLEAARALAGRPDDPEAPAALASAWRSEKDRDARRSIVRELARLGRSSRPALLEATKDPEARVRAAAFEALSRLDRDDATEGLFRSALADDKEAYGVRKAALRGLAAWKVKDRDSLLAGALKSRSDRDTIAAAALRLRLEGDRPEVREAAVLDSKFGRPVPLRLEAVAAIGRLAEDDPALRRELVDLVTDPERQVRSAAWEAVKGLKLKEALPALKSRRGREDPFAALSLNETIEAVEGNGRVSAVDAGGWSDELRREAAELESRARALRQKIEALRPAENPSADGQSSR